MTVSKPWRSEKVRRLREDVGKFVALLAEQMPDEGIIGWELGGSYARHAPDVGDLDVVVHTLTGRFDDMCFPKALTIQHRGEQIVQGDLVAPDGDTIHADFWCVRPEQYGAFRMFIIGPKALNISQRKRAQKLGLTLSQYGLFNSQGEQLDDGTEEGIYRLLKLPYITPRQRQTWAEETPAEGTTMLAWRVRSSRDRSKFYTVTQRGALWTCECPAFTYCRTMPQSCKHIKRVQGTYEPLETL